MKLSCVYQFLPKRRTCNTSFVQTVFGIGPEVGRNVIARDVEVDYAPGQIILFSGPSGSGKSSLLREAAKQAEGALALDECAGGTDALIDSLGGDAGEAAHLLSLCGLAEALLMLRCPDELSDGQRYRFGLAKILAVGARTLVADEWCAKLDRVTAKVLSRNARKITDKRGIGMLLATTHEDVIADLRPDTIVWCRGNGVVEVEKRRPFRGPISFHEQLQITKGTGADWPFFARWHYRGHGLGPLRRVLVLWHDREPIGICILGFGPLSSSARNRLFGLSGKLTKATAARINRNFVCVSRLVLDPRYRGAGIASAFLRRVCELAPWPWVELVSEMANLVPFCEAAGFRLVSRARDKTKAPPGGSRSAAGAGRGHYGKSNWTAEGYGAYLKKVRFSRPAYYVFDNRKNCPYRARAGGA